MAKQQESEVKWLKEVEEHNFPAAESYLSLLYPKVEAQRLATKLRKVELTEFKAKDIFRASQLSLLGVSNFHVERDRKKIRKGVALSPILLVRDLAHRRTVVADGYHRLCAVYGFDEDCWIPCKIV
ncbi:MAG: hypothetical protein EBR81_03750 [Proteobacteria bacterium]|jgi:hypothetical protein|nr:hypothetical protein [Pseudomonadota bacterium]